MSLEFAHFTPEEMKQVDRIIDRAMELGNAHNIPIDPLTLQMDLAATHKHCPLRLKDLAEANDFDFAHDVLGIRSHMNRETGLLEHCFVPRFARRT